MSEFSGSNPTDVGGPDNDDGGPIPFHYETPTLPVATTASGQTGSKQRRHCACAGVAPCVV